MTNPTVRPGFVSSPVRPGGLAEPINSPLGELEMTPEVALYVGTLEAQLSAYAINEVKYRVILELLTGTSWYTTQVNIDLKVLANIAVEALVKRGVDGIEARKLVSQRLSMDDNGKETVASSEELVADADTVSTLGEEYNVAYYPRGSKSVEGEGFSPSLEARFENWKERKKKAEKKRY